MILFGVGGNDTLSALAGNDYLAGGAGNDSHDGGLGTDTCQDSSGTNTFTSCESTPAGGARRFHHPLQRDLLRALGEPVGDP
jgi:Ca2+-binding RTX toxin-like protein